MPQARNPPSCASCYNEFSFRYLPKGISKAAFDHGFRMRIRLIKGSGTSGRLRCERADGTRYACEMPMNAAYHDLAHYVVEMRLGIGEGVWGTIARGHGLEDYALENADRPFPISAEAYRAELLATLVQSAVPTGTLSGAFVEMLHGSYVARGLPFPELPDDGVMAGLIADAQALTRAWEGLAEGEALELEF